ncbi:hypothetical protein Trydic_g3918 [Trypoxylus dichotomus]
MEQLAVPIQSIAFEGIGQSTNTKTMQLRRRIFEGHNGNGGGFGIRENGIFVPLSNGAGGYSRCKAAKTTLQTTCALLLYLERDCQLIVHASVLLI